MRKLLLLVAILAPITLLAQNGDTITVQTFTYGSPQDAWFELPSDTNRYEKILMYYKLKCNPAQSPACGEWDYLTYTYLYDHTGVLDSTLYEAPSFTAAGQSPDTFMYMTSPSYSYWHNYDYFIVYDDTTALDSFTLGLGATTTNQTFNSAYNDGKAQYLWTATELTNAGVGAGDITGLAFEFDNTGSELKGLTIRIKHTGIDSLTADNHETTGFDIVYQANTTIQNTGKHKFNFNTPFNWDGTSNVVIEVCFNNVSAGNDNTVLADTAWAGAGVVVAENNYFLDFEGPDYVNVPAQAFANVDSFISIMFWQFGDPAIQPQADYIFEGLDSAGNRVVNSHLPWNNGHVYWDAGNSGSNSYDRIEKQAADADFEGQWNHWAFTKNAANGEMNIYLNGALWHSGSGFTRDMSGIAQFKIGARGNGNGTHYDGYIEEFSVWNTDLPEATIAAWMKKDIDNTHPNYANLNLYYQFNEGTGAWVNDASGNGHNGYMSGMPAWIGDNGCDLFKNIAETSIRPKATFEQGTFTSHLDSVAYVDSLENPQVQIVLYSDSLSPLTATDTILAWPTYFNNYTYDNNGNAIDSVAVTSDDTLYLSMWPYYGEPFEVIDRYELARFITPYGIGLNLHDGFTWVYDVSDYKTLLHDSVHLTAGNWQEFLDMKFLFIKGTPPRDVLSLENMWNGNYQLSSFDQTVAPKKVEINPNAENFRLNVRTSGHGFGNSSANCAEFCDKVHSVDVDNSTIYDWHIIQECADNPLYPQGGTWVYDRAGWCPGAKVPTQEVDLTPHVTAGDSATIDYNYANPDPFGNYIVETQLVSYSAPNFSLDAAVEDVVAPSIKDEYYRDNPICKEPIIVIKNTGSTALTSLTIEYGLENGTPSTYQWTGSLDFLQTERVTLPTPDWSGIVDGKGIFKVTISSPNGGSDGYAPNNQYFSEFEIPEIMPDRFVIWTKTNLVPSENSWTLKDDAGNILYSRDNMDVNTTYKDTVQLPYIGCFHFELEDLGHNGLSWWANNDGSGYIRFRGASTPAVLETFDSKWTISGNQSQYRGDFGQGISYHFTTNWGLSVEDFEPISEVNIFPNPSAGSFMLDLALVNKQDVQVEIFNLTGQRVYTESYSQVDYMTQEINLSNEANGIYLVNIITKDEVVSRKLVLNR